jgi:hypothetical protein
MDTALYLRPPLIALGLKVRRKRSLRPSCHDRRLRRADEDDCAVATLNPALPQFVFKVLDT